ncbi:methyl-accepting chemotaxis protein [Novimethylophilus kurashikiensis]|uniref:Methyl-accepting chemotaxis protein n=1 Tax=Novimethylophilus kurashikiensis TaxID=1825523 RepID=A0A2R5F277_9PROT|nr:methyl-accepting chemotaxis protein [Novimethylophilus kurashikiensis]GBG12736.1 methyl-accepting chemotaxis protein [Novimethylophilus kurashikiensis]
MKFRTRLLIPPLIAIVMLLALGIATFTALQSIRSDVEKLATQGITTMTLANDARAGLNQTNLAVYRLITWIANFDDERINKETAQINAGIDQVAKTLDKAAQVQGLTDDEKKALESITAELPKYRKSLKQAIDMASSDPASGAGMMQSADKKFQKISDAVNALLLQQQKNADSTVARVDTKTARSVAVSLVILATALVISLLATWRVIRGVMSQLGGEPEFAAKIAARIAAGDLTIAIETSKGDTTSMLAAMKDMSQNLSQIVGEIRASAVDLVSASGEVSATAQSMSQATNEQAASVEETSASIEQMSASIAQNTDNAKITEGIATKAAREAHEGGEAVKATVSAMKQIAGKIGIIDDIAYQTNLLALNAAIEAARAGEHGKGFAVVASEVRKLAERSQVAAQEISEVAKSSVDLAEKAGKLLDDMVPAISRTSDLVQEITAASEEQSSGTSQVNIAMSQLSQITQQNASSSEELAATAEEMSASAEQLQQLVGFFTVAGQASITRTTSPSEGSASQRPAEEVLPSAAAVEAEEAEFVQF